MAGEVDEDGHGIRSVQGGSGNDSVIFSGYLSSFNLERSSCIISRRSFT